MPVTAASRTVRSRASVAMAVLALLLAGCASRHGSSGVVGPESPIGVTVSASLAEVWTGTTSGSYVLGPAEFDVVVMSMRCNGEDCVVTLRVTNRSGTAAQFPCYDLAALDSADQRYGSSTAGLGNNVAGCDGTQEYPPGVATTTAVTLFGAGRVRLVRLVVPGAGYVVLAHGSTVPGSPVESASFSPVASPEPVACSDKNRSDVARVVALLPWKLTAGMPEPPVVIDGFCTSSHLTVQAGFSAVKPQVAGIVARSGFDTDVTVEGLSNGALITVGGTDAAGDELRVTATVISASEIAIDIVVGGYGGP